jgi:hypothetical protein
MIGWIANALMLYGSYCVGERRRYGFLMQLTGNGLWAYIGVCKYNGDEKASLIAISVAFCCLYAFNFYKWGRNHEQGTGRD